MQLFIDRGVSGIPMGLLLFNGGVDIDSWDLIIRNWMQMTAESGLSSALLIWNHSYISFSPWRYCKIIDVNDFSAAVGIGGISFFLQSAVINACVCVRACVCACRTLVTSFLIPKRRKEFIGSHYPAIYATRQLRHLCRARSFLVSG